MCPRYNFGTSPELLFKPCDSSDNDMCFIGGEGRSYAYDPIIRLKPKVKDIIETVKAEDIPPTPTSKESVSAGREELVGARSEVRPIEVPSG